MNGLTLNWKEHEAAAGQSAVMIRAQASLLVAVLSGFIYFPYVGGLQGYDIQPFSFIAAAIGAFWAFVLRRVRFRIDDAILVSVFLPLLGLRLIVQLLEQDLSGQVLRSFGTTMFHFATIFVVGILVRARLIYCSSRAVFAAVFVYSLVGLVQLFFPDFMSFAVYRGDQELRATGRGVRSLFSEPAVFGNMLVLFNLLAVFGLTHNRRLAVLKVAACCTLFLLLNLVLAQSFYAVAVHAIVLLILAALYSFRLFLACCVLSAIAFGAIVEFADSGAFRFALIARMLLESPMELFQQGAILRVLNLPISLYGGFLHGLFGSGFWPEEAVSGQIRLGIGDPFTFEVADRNMGGVVEIFLRMGLFSLPILGAYFFSLARIWSLRVWVGAKNVKIGRWYALGLFLTSGFYSSIANPIVWVVFFVLYEAARSNNRSLIRNSDR